MTLDVLLLGAFPYVALAVVGIGTVYRYRRKGFTVSSLSSQFLEGRALFWGSVPFHIGILVVFLGHLFAFLLPDTVLAWNSRPLRLFLLEATGLAFGLAVVVGLGGLMVRRFTNPRVRSVTSGMDVAVEVLLLAQVVLGVWIAVGYRWGSSWFASDLSPYLISLVKFSPELDAVSALPWVVKLHIVGAFLVLAMIPFSRLMHLLVAPLNYLVRRYQVVIWNRDPGRIRDPRSGWRPRV